MIPVVNPSTHEWIGEVADADKADVDRAVACARESYEKGVWRNLPAARRAEVLWRAADIIKQRVDEMAEVEAEPRVIGKSPPGRSSLPSSLPRDRARRGDQQRS